VQLQHRGIESRRELGDARRVEMPARDHDRPCPKNVPADPCLENIAVPAKRMNARAEAQRESHVTRVPLLVVGDLFFAREWIVAARERHPR